MPSEALSPLGGESRPMATKQSTKEPNEPMDTVNKPETQKTKVPSPPSPPPPRKKRIRAYPPKPRR
jgi:hypothetical protein